MLRDRSYQNGFFFRATRRNKKGDIVISMKVFRNSNVKTLQIDHRVTVEISARVTDEQRKG